MFNLTLEQIKENNATHTAREIHQQPEVWQELMKDFFNKQDTFKDFLTTIYNKHEFVRVIMTGAGTSAFIGDTLVPELAKQGQKNVRFESIPTTDIVSNPTEYLFKDTPTVLVSFARSGNSPESVATVSLGKEIIDDFYQVVITCNKDGQLVKNIADDEHSITLLAPEKSNDQSLAMTSSFSTMILAAYALFTAQSVTENVSTHLIKNATYLIDELGELIDDVLTFDFERIVYLGSGLLAQLSHEASLKMLELSGGKVVSLHESSLGFRHGPKSILNEKSAVVLFLSQDPYTRKYDMDTLRELSKADTGMKIIVLSEREETELQELADWVIPVNFEEEKIDSDFHLALLYIIFAQVLAMRKSIQLGITPDNPSDGTINRVVQGVTIHAYE